MTTFSSDEQLDNFLLRYLSLLTPGHCARMSQLISQSSSHTNNLLLKNTRITFDYAQRILWIL